MTSESPIRWIRDHDDKDWHIAAEDEGLAVVCELSIPSSPLVIRKNQKRPTEVCGACMEKADQGIACPHCGKRHYVDFQGKIFAEMAMELQKMPELAQYQAGYTEAIMYWWWKLVGAGTLLGLGLGFVMSLIWSDTQ